MGYGLECTREESEWNRLHDLQQKDPGRYAYYQKLKDDIAYKVMKQMEDKDYGDVCDLGLHNIS